MTTLDLVSDDVSSDAAPVSDEPVVVDLWIVDTAAFGASSADDLDQEDRRRLQRLRRPAVRERFVARRAALRAVLESTDLPSNSRVARATCAGCGRPHGRPAIVDAATGRHIAHLSTSSSEDLFAVAISRQRSVGIDLEMKHLSASIAAAPHAFLGPTELVAGPHTPADLLRLWTLKEAWVKADGTAVAWDPKVVEFTLHPAVEPVIDGQGQRDIILCDLAGATVAVCALGAIAELTLRLDLRDRAGTRICPLPQVVPRARREV